MNIDISKLREPKKTDFNDRELPFFHDLKPDFDEILTKAERYKKYKNILMIGNGGAVNSFRVLYQALYVGDKNVEIINSMEPDLINSMKDKYGPDDTVTIVSSTSGTNVGVLEIMSQFWDYEMVVITADNDAPLKEIAHDKKLEILYVPHITDRYLTSGALAYFPLAILGVDIHKIDKALMAAYAKYAPDKDNGALKLSAALYELEQEGYTEVFVPIYSYKLEGFPIYITQMMHESVNKDGKGQSFLLTVGPESQHHTNQRFFGGHKNIVGLFIASGQEDSESKVILNTGVGDAKLRNGKLSDIEGVPLDKDFEFEYQATIEDAIDNKIPVALIKLNHINEESIAEFMAFWHYMAVYSSWLRDVNPFEQPQVERSKQIGFEKRMNWND